MNYLQVYLFILLIFLVILALIPYTIYEFYDNDSQKNTKLTDININLDGIFNSSKKEKINGKRPRVIVPIYAPWRMYYPWEYIYPSGYPPLQSSPFYPFFDQYNIYQGIY